MRVLTAMLLARSCRRRRRRRQSAAASVAVVDIPLEAVCRGRPTNLYYLFLVG